MRFSASYVNQQMYTHKTKYWILHSFVDLISMRALCCTAMIYIHWKFLSVWNKSQHLNCLCGQKLIVSSTPLSIVSHLRKFIERLDVDKMLTTKNADNTPLSAKSIAWFVNFTTWFFNLEGIFSKSRIYLKLEMISPLT